MAENLLKVDSTLKRLEGLRASRRFSKNTGWEFALISPPCAIAHIVVFMHKLKVEFTRVLHLVPLLQDLINVSMNGGWFKASEISYDFMHNQPLVN